MQGNCERDENSCGFLHDEQYMETEQVFHYAQEKTPPDQLSLMMNSMKEQIMNSMKEQLKMLELKMLKNSVGITKS